MSDVTYQHYYVSRNIVSDNDRVHIVEPYLVRNDNGEDDGNV